MWGSLKTIVAQYYNYNSDEIEQQKTTDDIDGWVIVDKSGREVEKETLDAEIFDSPKKLTESRLKPLPLLDISNTSSAQSSPQLSPTKIEEGWLVAPPPCFTLNCPTSLEISPLEDLLIEHPSMSVYGRIPNMKQHEQEVDKKSLMLIKSKIEVEPDKEGSLINSSVKTDVKSDIHGSHYEIAGLFNQVENMKPAQQAKWENEQYKLCPSYMTRQNRVHRYQSRKHHNQKKKSLSKPFAEKGRHSF